ncbi:MAG: lipid A biosynthesis acyltransferase, partial [Candidatus Lindowbacteria bacterium]|nr:lipid A biosynthesis acyltransferase [Candidatus Lindowbacteria bacterium]
MLKTFWRSHQKNFLELFIMPRLNSQTISRLATFEGLDHLDYALRQGKGAILAVPHFGNERFLHVALALKGYPINVLSAKY